MIEVFVRFLLLGCMSFGGPIAHIGYFQQEFVNKRKWLNEKSFSCALSLCQFLPGPASSQLGMYIGFQRAGYLGALAAFVGFTLPSFILLTTAAIFSSNLQGSNTLTLLIFAAKLLAVIVVADAIWTMGKKFVNDTVTLFSCVTSALWLIWQSGLFAQILPIIVAGSVGWLLTKNAITNDTPSKVKASKIYSKHRISLILLGIFLVLLIAPIFFESKLMYLFFHFYQAGSFVFGGGHVVLPLLEPLIGDLLSSDALLEGYAAAQLVPGPMFTIASYLGASISEFSPLLTSLIATIAIFLPGALLLFAALPIWQAVMDHHKFSGSVKLINATVVGLLIAAFYQPVLTSSIYNAFDAIVAVIGLTLLRKFQLSVFWLLGLLLGYAFLASLMS